MRNLKEALHIVSAGIDYLYEEEHSNYKQISEAESTLYKLITELRRKGIVNLEDLEKLM